MGKKKVCIQGMHCASCEVLITKKLKQVPGVEGVKVDYRTGEADVEYSSEPSMKKMRKAVAKAGYRLVEGGAPVHVKNTKKDYVEIGALVIILLAVYFLLKQFNLIPETFGVSDNMSLGFVFVLGLIAATSTCLAVAGGLLLAVAAKYSEAHPELSGAKKFKPHIYFNIGRLVSYAALGALLGYFGSFFSFSPTASAVITFIAAAFMIIIGLQMLHLWPRRLAPKMPSFLAHRVYDSSSKEYRPTAPFFLGAATFVLPCGFTQALQLYVIGKGDALTGALVMGVFALGTMPSLLSLGAITSFSKRAFHKHFLRFAAVLVILLGIFNVGAAMALWATDNGGSMVVQTGLPKQDPNVQLIDGKQVVHMKIVGYGYEPSRFTVEVNKPVEWVVDATQGAGCGRVLVAPKAGVRAYIPTTETFTFTPTKAGSIPFNCGMGMMDPGSFEVVAAVEPVCDPAIANCVA